MDQNRIFEASPSRENELLQILFWTKKGTTAYVSYADLHKNESLFYFEQFKIVKENSKMYGLKLISQNYELTFWYIFLVELTEANVLQNNLMFSIILRLVFELLHQRISKVPKNSKKIRVLEFESAN